MRKKKRERSKRKRHSEIRDMHRWMFETAISSFRYTHDKIVEALKDANR